MEVFRPHKIPWFDSDLSVSGDIAPLPVDLDSRQTFRKLMNEVECGLYDDFTSMVDEPVLIAYLPSSQSLAEVSPY